MPMPHDIIKGKTVVLVSNNAWSVYNFRLDVIRWLLKSGARVIVLSPDDEYAGRLVNEGCEFVSLSFNNRSANPFGDLSLYFSLKKFYTSLKPDIIFHYVAKPNIYGSLAAASKKIPSVAVITGLGYPFAKKNWLYFLMKTLYSRALRNTREVWFLNKDDARVFVSEKMVSIAKVKVLAGEGVNTAHFTRSHERGSHEQFRFIMSTRLLNSKGVALYADAARLLRKKNYKVHCALIGFFEAGHPDTIDPQQLDAWIREGTLDYGGFVQDVRPFLSDADCLVFPSYYSEGVPRCLMEAASMELPAITSLNRGCKEVVHDNINGMLCQPNDVFDLADKMEKMILLPAAAREEMGRRGRELVVQKFDVRKIIDEYANTLISAFEKQHGSNRSDSRAIKNNS